MVDGRQTGYATIQSYRFGPSESQEEFPLKFGEKVEALRKHFNSLKCEKNTWNTVGDPALH